MARARHAGSLDLHPLYIESKLQIQGPTEKERKHQHGVQIQGLPLEQREAVNAHGRTGKAVVKAYREDHMIRLLKFNSIQFKGENQNRQTRTRRATQ